MAIKLRIKYSEVASKEELKALQVGAEMMEVARRSHLTMGAGNIELPLLLTDGAAHYWNQKTRSYCYNKTIQKKVEKLYKEIGKARMKSEKQQSYVRSKSIETIDDYLCECMTTYSLTAALPGGACAENANTIAALLVLRGRANSEYNWLHRVYLPQPVSHEICLLGKKSRTIGDMGRYVLLDPWVPMSQACLFKDSCWYSERIEKMLRWSMELGKKKKEKKLHEFYKKVKEIGEKNRKEGEKWIEDIIKKGEKVEMLYECDTCKRKFSRGGLVQWHYDVKTEPTSDWSRMVLVPGENKCPTQKYTECNGELTDLRPRITIPLILKDTYKDLKGKGWKNLGVESYSQDSILSKGWDGDKGELTIIAYTKGNESNARKYWVNHLNRMREYSWGRIEYYVDTRSKWAKSNQNPLKLMRQRKVWYSVDVDKKGVTGERGREKEQITVYKQCWKCKAWGFAKSKECFKEKCKEPYGDDGNTRW